MRGPTLRIALHETRRYVGFLDRRVILAFLVTGLVAGGLFPFVQDRGVHPEAGLYVVGVEGRSPVLPILESDPAFQIVDVPAGGPVPDGLDLLVQGDVVLYDDTSEKSKSASARLELAARRWLDDALADETDQDAAYPVEVNIVYQARGLQPGATDVPDDEPVEPAPRPRPSNDTPPGPGPVEPPVEEEPELLAQQGTQQVGLRPNEVDPPFPLRSLLLTFAYLIPLTFVAELYSGSLFAERVRARGVLLLSGPVTPGQILLGKSVPYLAITALLALAVTFAIGADLVGLAAALPVLAFVLASSLVLSLTARSQRGLTFLLVSTNVLLSTFLFLPPLFSGIDPVAFLSPVAVITASIDGEAVGLGPFLYATLPLTLITAVLVTVGVGLYREESLFSPRGVASKVVDSIDRLARTKWRLFLAGALAVPFAFGLELFVLIFAVTLDLRTAFFVFLLGSAFVEESLKALPSYAQSARAGDRAHAPWVVGSLVGFGFFVGEKGALALSVLGFGLLPQGSEALATFGVAANPLLVVAPLVLHVAAATIVAYASRNGRRATALGLLAAGLLHFAYNASIVYANLGGLPR